MNNNSWSTSIDKLMLWRASSWMRYEAKLSNLVLRVLYDQLLVTSDTKILETFNMHHKMKGIYKDDVLILIVSNANQEIRKLKFRLKSNAEQCYQRLGEHFPVVNHKNASSSDVFSSKYRDINEILKCALDKDDSSALNVPSDWNNFIKLCLLDPTFPQLVNETEKMFKKLFF